MPQPLLPTIHGPRDLQQIPTDDLPRLADEIRHAICEQVSRSGGHLAPNLGVVELTIALHYVFDFAHDRLLFDVGHQCYPHKLLTGRYPLLGKLRQRGGMSGFPEPNESDFDLFSVGHAGTAISTAVGLARGDDVRAALESDDPTRDPAGRSDRKTVALVGDASIVNGVALEGLNNAGTLQRQFLTVLNDNGMSISQPQGAMATYFDRVRVSPTYHDLKRRGKDILDRLPGGTILEEVYHRGSEMLKAMISDGHMFEHFGHICIGPVDGHDLPTLIATLAEVRDIDRPVLLHVKTIKGKGYEFSEGDATTFHSPKPFKRDGCRVELDAGGGGQSFTAGFAQAMSERMAQDPKIFTVTAAMGPGTGVDKLLEKYPARTLDTGICESHAMDMCAGLAKAGLKPFFAVYSTFAQRALDQVFQEVALQGLPVRVCMDRAGYVGGDGAVHHGFMDIAMFRAFPGVTQLAASDGPTLDAALRFMQDHDAGASFLRYPRDSMADPPILADPPPFELGRAACVHPAKTATPDLAILAYGTPVVAALAGLPALREHGHDVAVYDARFAEPIDLDLVTRLLDAGVPILTIEDHLVDGGFGSAVLDAANAAQLDTRLIHRHGMPRRWVGPDSRARQLADAGLDPAGIAARGREVIAAYADTPDLHRTPLSSRDAS
ncbi:MAG: 1-deoxy-D-xylulose-5-phosphate synthase [Planctomycetota bacterium]